MERSHTEIPSETPAQKPEAGARQPRLLAQFAAFIFLLLSGVSLLLAAIVPAWMIWGAALGIAFVLAALACFFVKRAS